ncbi:hypothetical protein N7462_001442 [Penicillium macrosclerotiorum]|uniref:uncharacterized protein n=1 Tax=Penicillium macrosclerotiorum TaxID=303699 RepID=UPI0025491006|nr:uncharacterized protein N7462_001442 [Penicillium macrosclerotiorum]KAJ5692019.1 hypothetical protein N7462_001442 [Penicillium macrosclerotiorum]
MNSMADKIFLETHINVFFDYFNAIPQYNFIHKATFLRSFYHDTLDPLFLRCVCGVASRFLRPRSAPEYVVEWLKEVEAQIWSRMGEMKLQNLQILVLLICWYLMERKISNMWIASGVAARMAYGIRLNYETSDKIPFLSRELRRRLMWSIFMLDKLYAGGFTELVLCSPSTMHIKLPCEERNFELDMTVETPILEPARPDSQLESNIGIMGYITRLMNIRHAVLEITKQIISSNANPYSAQDSIQSLDNMLNSFALSLPAHLRDSPRNLLCRAYTSELAGYINLHTLWHQCYCDLYRMMIPGIRESVPELVQRQVPVEYADECRRLCLHHAVGMCKLWSDTLREADISRISDQSIGIYAYQCANVLVNLWDLDRDDTLESSLQTISSFLDHLSLIYPVVAEVQLEVKSFISKLNVVADFYHTHAHQNLAPRLTAAWRSSLRQQGTQEGQTTSRFSLLEYLQNQNSAEDPGTPGEYCAAPVNDVPADPVPLPEVNIGMGLTADASSPDRPDLLTDELWPEESLVIDFDTDGTHVDPFSRIFGDWSLVTEPQSSLQEPPRH